MPCDPNPNKCAFWRFCSNVASNLGKQLYDTGNWFVVSPKGFKALPCFLGLRQFVSATLQLWNDLEEEGISFLMTSQLKTDCLENFFSVLRMHDVTYNLNFSVKAVPLMIRKKYFITFTK